MEKLAPVLPGPLRSSVDRPLQTRNCPSGCQESRRLLHGGREEVGPGRPGKARGWRRAWPPSTLWSEGQAAPRSRDPGSTRPLLRRPVSGLPGGSSLLGFCCCTHGPSVQEGTRMGLGPPHSRVCCSAPGTPLRGHVLLQTSVGSGVLSRAALSPYASRPPWGPGAGRGGQSSPMGPRGGPASRPPWGPGAGRPDGQCPPQVGAAALLLFSFVGFFLCFSRREGTW